MFFQAEGESHDNFELQTIRDRLQTYRAKANKSRNSPNYLSEFLNRLRI